MKKSRWKRYDAKSGLWIASTKPVFAYWFRFLKHAAVDPDRQVDWSSYEKWGDREYMLQTSQTDWWKSKWKTLFGYKEDEAPLYALSTSKPQSDAIRIALMVYDLRDKPLLNGRIEGTGKVGDYWEIAKRIAAIEFPKRRAKQITEEENERWVFNISRVTIAKRLQKEDPEGFRLNKRTVQSRVGRYMQQAELHLDNVCRGQFP